MTALGKFTEKKPVEAQDSISYGTHTLPKEFWTDKKHAPLLKDAAFRLTRLRKKARHAQNQMDKAEINRNGPTTKKGK